MHTNIPPRYRGVWQRTSIERPTGVLEDNTSAVFWVQTKTLFTDIRIPKRSNTEGSNAPLPEILKQRASAGFSEIDESRRDVDSVFQWNCELDYHPPCDVADIGSFEFLDKRAAIEEGSRHGENLDNYDELPTTIERGLPPLDYREVWVKRDDGKKQTALSLKEEIATSSVNHVPRGTTRRGIWLLTGTFWSCTFTRFLGEDSIGTRIASNKADSLGELFARWGLDEDTQRNAATEFEGYFGKIEKHEGKICFVILHATRAHQEGQIFLEIKDDGGDAARDSLERSDATGVVVVNHLGWKRTWSIVELGHEEILKASSKAAL